MRFLRQTIDVKSVSKKTDVFKNKDDIIRRIVRKHLNAISAIIAGKRKASKTGLSFTKYMVIVEICQTHFLAEGLLWFKRKNDLNKQ